MMMDGGALWSVWWIWLCLAIALALLEIFVPGFVFLGFAAGGLLISLILLVSGNLFPLPVLLLVFAILSLGAWLTFRRLFALRDGQVKTFDHDING